LLESVQESWWSQVGERLVAYQTAQFGRWKEIIKSLDIPVG